VISNRRSPATELMLPVKMLEYIAFDIPVVVPRLRAIQYYFDENMATFFEPENLDSLADAILSLYGSRARRELQAREARCFLDHYGWETHQSELIDLYKSLKRGK